MRGMVANLDLNTPTAADWIASGVAAHVQADFPEAVRCFREATDLDPTSAEAWTNLGLSLACCGDADTALACQREALRLDPDLADAHNNIGVLHCERGHLAEAENCFHAVLRRRPEFPNARINLGVVHQAMGRLADAEQAYRDALPTVAAPATALNNLGMALLEQGRVAEAESVLRDALLTAPDSPNPQVNLGLVTLLNGRFEEGWRLYEARWRVDPTLSASGPIDAPRWTGEESLFGKTILLHAEQGFGDTLQFCRYAPLVAALGARVILAVQPSMARLLGVLKGVHQVVVQGGPPPVVDFHCPLMSLPLAFGTRLETIPAAVRYLRADAGDVARWAERLAGLSGRRVGLVWAGSDRRGQAHAAAINRRRSIPFATVAPLLDSPDCAFVSLQHGAPAPDARLFDPGSALTDFAETAALIANLDLVIAVDTAVAHLAGALGKPVWLLNRFDTCWRWLRDRDDSPWYPTLRQFRQDAPNDWAPVIARVAEALLD